MINERLSKIIGEYLSKKTFTKKEPIEFKIGRTYYFDKSIWGDVCNFFSIDKKNARDYISDWITKKDGDSKVTLLEHLEW